jgi:hypothetical protein
MVDAIFGGKEVENVGDMDAPAANAGAFSALLGIDRNS